MKLPTKTTSRPKPRSEPKLLPECVHLQDRFGRQFRVGYEESYYAQHGPNATTVDPWYMEILCQNSTIGPWGGDDLVACTNSAGPVTQALKALSFARVQQDGSDGVRATAQQRPGCPPLRRKGLGRVLGPGPPPACSENETRALCRGAEDEEAGEGRAERRSYLTHFDMKEWPMVVGG